MDSVACMRRFGFKRCLDFEHLIMEIHGFGEQFFPGLIQHSAHIHMSGYTSGSTMWHTPLNYAPQQSAHLLDLLYENGYQGMVVSEASVSYQNVKEFKELNRFFMEWQH